MPDRFPPSSASASKEGHQSGRRKSLASPVSSVLARIHSTSILPQDRACQREALGARSALISHLAKQGQGKSKEAKLTLVCYAPQSLAEACNMVLPQAMHKTRHCASHLGHPRSIALIWFSQQADSTCVSCISIFLCLELSHLCHLRLLFVLAALLLTRSGSRRGPATGRSAPLRPP